MTQTRTAKRNRAPSIASQVLRDNLLRVMEERYPNASLTAQMNAVSKLCGVSLSQLQRMTVDPSDETKKTPRLNAAIDTVERVATALGVQTHEMLTPGFSTRQRAETRPANFDSQKIKRQTIANPLTLKN